MFAPPVRSVWTRCRRCRRGGSAALVIAALACTAAGAAQTRPTFYPDDPIARDEDTQDASKVRPRPIPLAWDLLYYLFTKPGDPVERRALSINTIDEVPDSSWFVNRAGARPLTPADVARGPNTTDGPARPPWRVSSGKSDGITPGFTIVDSAGVRWFVKFDPPSLPEMATGAEVVSTKLFWALGYHVPQNHVTWFNRTDLSIDEKSTIRKRNGEERRLTQDDIDRLLGQAARTRDGRYRAVASRALEGRPIGGFLYDGTRPDDPNDIIPHEHRRELRALRVFGAWLNHVDAKAINTLDTLVTERDRTIVRHHLIDFGSTLGSAAVKPRDYDEGYEYLYDGGVVARALLSFGFYLRPWATVDYEAPRPIGRFEGDAFDPEQWRTRVPNPAHVRARPDDDFWAARRVGALTDDLIAAAVKAAQYSDPAAERYLVETLIKRRDRIVAAYLPKVNPISAPALAADGTLSFTNAAVDAKVAKAPEAYEAAWFTFDNATSQSRPIGSPVRGAAAGIQAPAPLPQASGAFVRVDVAAVNPPHQSWTAPVRVFFRRTDGAWQLVGLERLPDRAPPSPTIANR